MIVYFNFKKEKGDEPFKVEKGSLSDLIPLHNMQYVERKKEESAKVPNEPKPASPKKQRWLSGLSILSIAIVFLAFCYTVWKDQRTANANDLFKDATTMKEFIVDQIVQAH